MGRDSSDRKPLPDIAARMFELHDEWHSIDRQFGSIRRAIMIPGFYRRFDFIAASEDLKYLQDSLRNLVQRSELTGPEDSVRRFLAYQIALAASLRLFKEVCLLENEYLEHGQRSSSEELRHKRSRYFKVRYIALSLRKQIEKNAFITEVGLDT